MAELPKAPQRGDDILGAFLRLRAWVKKESLSSVVGGRLAQTENGKTLTINGSAPTTTSASPTDPTIPGGDANGAGGADGYTKIAHCYAFEAWADEDKTGIFIEAGDIVLGPGAPNTEWIEWSSFGSASPAVTATDPFVYLVIDVADGSYGATMAVGSKSDMQGAVTGDDLKHTMVWPLVESVWADGVITKVKGLQCGNIVIPRL